MNRLFACLDDKFFKVPDGTLVNPFLNPKDIMSDLPWDLLDGLSIAAGVIDSGLKSKITVAPFVSQVTVLVSGSLNIGMKDPGNADKPYTRTLSMPATTGGAGFTTAAILTSPGTFLQLDNSEGREPAKVLYLTTPSYIFEPGLTPDAPPIYDDAVVVAEDWTELEKLGWNPPVLSDPAHGFAARQKAIQRLAARFRQPKL